MWTTWTYITAKETLGKVFLAVIHIHHIVYVVVLFGYNDAAFWQMYSFTRNWNAFGCLRFYDCQWFPQKFWPCSCHFASSSTAFPPHNAMGSRTASAASAAAVVSLRAAVAVVIIWNARATCFFAVVVDNTREHRNNRFTLIFLVLCCDWLIAI